MGARVPGSNGGDRRHRMGSLAEINVTPLVDVMLVLLIISILAAPVLQKGLPLELPETSTAEDIPEATLVLSVDSQGRLELNDRPVHESLLGERLEELSLGRKDERVYIRADKNLYYGEVLRVMDTIREAGFTEVALVTTPVRITGNDR